MFTKAEMQKIHAALHDPAVKTVEIQGTVLTITGSPAQEGTGFCREVLAGGVRWMTQKLNKTSRWAQAVREAIKQGKTLEITWGVRPQPDPWFLILDGHVTNDEPNFSARNYLIKKIGFAPSRNQGSMSTV